MICVLIALTKQSDPWPFIIFRALVDPSLALRLVVHMINGRKELKLWTTKGFNSLTLLKNFFSILKLIF